jgi:carbon storage regulator
MRRRAGEKLIIGGEIEIEILELNASRVKLGIVAPQHLAILRKEIQTVGVENATAARPIDGAIITSLVRRLARS